MLIKFLFLLVIYSLCSKEKGTYLIKVQIHLDDITIKKILLMESAMNLENNTGSRQKIVDYLNSIFNEINKDIENYGVQVIGDYSLLNFEDLDTNLNMEELCSKKLMAIEANLKLTVKLSYPNTDGLGLRIIGLSCKIFDPMQIPFFTLPNFSCGNIATIFVLDPLSLKYQISFLVKSFISNGIGGLMQIKSTAFRKSLCNFATRCTKHNDMIGTFLQDLTKVKGERDYQKD